MNMLFHLTANGLTKPCKINSNLLSKVIPEKQWIQRNMNIISTSLIEYGNYFFITVKITIIKNNHDRIIFEDFKSLLLLSVGRLKLCYC